MARNEVESPLRSRSRNKGSTEEWRDTVGKSGELRFVDEWRHLSSTDPHAIVWAVVANRRPGEAFVYRAYPHDERRDNVGIIATHPLFKKIREIYDTPEFEACNSILPTEQRSGGSRGPMVSIDNAVELGLWTLETGLRAKLYVLRTRADASRSEAESRRVAEEGLAKEVTALHNDVFSNGNEGSRGALVDKGIARSNNFDKLQRAEEIVAMCEARISELGAPGVEPFTKADIYDLLADAVDRVLTQDSKRKKR